MVGGGGEVVEEQRGVGDNGPPFALVELDEDTYKFLIQNCDMNMAFNLATISNPRSAPSSVEIAEAMNRKFKSARDALVAAQRRER